MRPGLAAVWLVVLAGAGCAPDAGPPAQDLHRSVGAWEREGKVVTEPELAVVAGPEHCDWESVTFLLVAWPPGEGGGPETIRQYVRDPHGKVDQRLADALELSVRPPADAEPTGYRSDEGLELWFAESDRAERAYLIDPSGETEAWPRNDGVACA